MSNKQDNWRQKDCFMLTKEKIHKYNLAGARYIKKMYRNEKSCIFINMDGYHVKFDRYLLSTNTALSYVILNKGVYLPNTTSDVTRRCRPVRHLKETTLENSHWCLQPLP